MLKNFFLTIYSTFLFILINSLSLSAADTKCASVFEMNCAECHDIERGCELLGQSQKEWKELFEFMEAMGADIPDDEKKLLTTCLNKPDDSVKKICKK